jgi:hypothetical protein
MITADDEAIPRDHAEVFVAPGFPQSIQGLLAE